MTCICISHPIYKSEVAAYISKRVAILGDLCLRHQWLCIPIQRDVKIKHYIG